jgi:putative oxygen-independent coproporphyrinogen III oxidase
MPSATAPWLSRSCCQPVLKTETPHIENDTRGLAIYVHWPFCLAKCPYCDFNSHVRDDFAQIDQNIWVRAFIADLKHDAARLKDGTGPATSLFFGGGTPSLMDSQTVAAVIETIDKEIGFSADAEITLEANPTSVEAARFQGYVQAGVNRFSLGVQALRNDDLQKLGRQHSVAEALAAIDVAKKYCDNISFDLIYARAGQTLEAWQAELTEALAYHPTHLSLYQLTIERGTRFHERWKQGDLVLPEEDLAADMFDFTNAACAAKGLAAYEVSNYAKPGFESRHNISYWRSDPYMGIGPGAHGRLVTDLGRLATTRLRSPEKWLARIDETGHGVETEEMVAGGMLVAEVLMMGLRLKSGLSETRFQAVTGKTFAQALPADELADLVGQGFVDLKENVLAVTQKGRSVLNAVTEKLLV